MKGLKYMICFALTALMAAACYDDSEVWDKFDDIDFDKLPKKFVLKCNHNSDVVICTDKSSLDIEKTRIQAQSEYNNKLFNLL